jgi:hypothetical protein
MEMKGNSILLLPASFLVAGMIFLAVVSHRAWASCGMSQCDVSEVVAHGGKPGGKRYWKYSHSLGALMRSDSPMGGDPANEVTHAINGSTRQWLDMGDPECSIGVPIPAAWYVEDWKATDAHIQAGTPVGFTYFTSCTGGTE